MQDADTTMGKKIIERKKYSQFVNVLKKFVGVITITKRSLDLGVSLIIGELLVSAPTVEKQPTKAISEDENVQFRVNTLGSAEVLETPSSYFWYSMELPKIKVCLEDGSKVIALLDTSAEINPMINKCQNLKEMNLIWVSR